MGWVLFADVATPGQIETLANGSIRVKGQIARTGLQSYAPWPGSKIQDRMIRVLRPASEVFKDTSLATLRGATVTIGHPPEREVTPETWRKYAVGLNEGDAVRTSDAGEDFVQTSLIISDAKAIEMVKGKQLCEISQGYKVELDWTAGVTTDGQAYDAIQTQIVHNHTALLAPGEARAGKSARVLIDSNEEPPMNRKKFAASVLAPALSAYFADSKGDKAKAIKAGTEAALATVSDATDAMTEEEVSNLVAVGIKAALAAMAPAADEETPEEKEARLAKEKEAATPKTDAVDGAALAKSILDASKTATADAVAIVDAREEVRDMLDSSYDYAGKSVRQLRLDALKAKAPAVYAVVKDKSDDTIAGAFTFARANRASWIVDSKSITQPGEHRARYSKRMNDAFVMPGSH